MNRQRFLTFFLIIGLTVLVPVAFSATQQVFQAGSGYEIITDTATQNLNISTKSTDGGGIHINARQTGNGIFVDTANNVGIGTLSPGYPFHVNGNIAMSPNAGANRYFFLDNTDTGTGVMVLQAGAGSAGFGGALNLFAHSHATKPGWVTAGLSSSAGSGATEARFTVNNQGLAGGTDVFTVLRTGNVGIGDTTPTEGTLTVSGTGYFSNTVTVGTPTAAGHAATKSYVDSISAGSSGVWLLSGSNLYASSTAWNVGIGTTGPTSKLQVVGSGLNSIFSTTDGSSYSQTGWTAGTASGYVWENGQSVASGFYGGPSAMNVYNGANAPLTFSTNATAQMTILGGGNVGIGTTTPGATLHVDATAGGIIRATRLGTGAGVIQLEADGTDGKLATTNKMFFDTGGSTKMTILGTNGNVGIGITNPSAKLHIEGSTPVIKILNTANREYSIKVESTSFKIRDESGAADRLTIDVNGNVGIATTSPAYALQVYGTGAFSQPVVVGTPTAAGHAATKSYVDSISAGSSGVWLLSGSNLYASSTSWNVGIGTTAPDLKLVLQATDGTSRIKILDGSSLRFTAGDDVGNGGFLQIANDAGTVTTYLRGDTGNSYFNGGNVGIATTSPAYALQVYGTGAFSQPLIVGTPTAASHATTKSYVDSIAGGSTGVWLLSGSNLYASSTAWSVGIGTTSPDGKLHIAGTGASPAKMIWERTDGATGAKDWTAYIASDHRFLIGKADDSGTLTNEYLTILTGGNVGVATTTPGEKLSVTGNVNVTGNITAGGSVTGSVSATQVSAGIFGSVAGKGNYTFQKAADTDPVLYVDATNGRVGVATSSPSYALTVTGDIYATGDYLGNIKKLIEEFTVETGQTITAGNVVSFINGKIMPGTVAGSTINSVGGQQGPFSTDYRDGGAVGLGSNKFVIAYNYVGGSNVAVVGEVAGNSVSFGTMVSLSPGSATMGWLDIAALSSSKVAIAMGGSTGGFIGWGAIVCDVSGLSLSCGSPSVANSDLSSAQGLAITALSSTQFVIGYYASAQGSARVGNVSGTTISSYGAEANSGGGYNQQMATLDSTHFIVAHGGGGGTGRARAGSISGSTITMGSEIIFNNASTIDTDISPISSSQAVVVYKDVANSNQGTAMVLEISGTTVTSNTEYIFNNADSTYLSSVMLDSTHVAIAYKDSDTYAKAIVGAISGTTITFGTEATVNGANTNRTQVASLGSGKFTVSYDSTYGYTRILEAAGGRFVGVAKQSGSAGSVVGVITSGVADVFSSLTTGSTYYALADGSLTTTENTYRVGLAISSTKILLNGNRDNSGQFFGDMIFANDLKITEDWGNSGFGRGLIFKNTLGRDMLTLYEGGEAKFAGAVYTAGNISADGTVTAGRVSAKELCVEDVCVTRDQFLKMVELSNKQ
ncbi:MAG: hypothetical protein V2A55_00785 [Candidatus Jorgensenbacteria bacterium]